MLECLNSGFNLPEHLLSVLELSFIVLYFFLFHVSLSDLFLQLLVVFFSTFKAQLEGVDLLSLVLDPFLEVCYFYRFLVDLLDVQILVSMFFVHFG